MGKRKIAIEKIDDKKKMNVTFSKRRKGLFGKALNTSGLYNFKIAMVVFSPAGNPYTFVTPTTSVDDVIDQYLKTIPFNEKTEVEWEGKKQMDQLHQCSCEGKKVGFWWDLIDVDKYSSLEELQLVRSSLESLRRNVCQKLDDAHSRQLLRVENESRDVAASDFVTDLSSGPSYSVDESGDVAASDSVTALSFCPLPSTDEDAGTVFATINDDSYVDWTVTDGSGNFFDHLLDDNSAAATTSDFISEKALYPMSGADEDDWIVANDSVDFFDHLFDDNGAGTTTSDFMNDEATYPMSGVDEDAIKGLATNDDKSYSNMTVLDNSSNFFEQILSFWS